MSDERGLAYRYDLFVSPDWRGRFDAIVDESVEFPREGRILDVNCGTGAHALELALRLGEKGEVMGVDPAPARLELARAKAQIQKLKNITFEQAISSDLPFVNHEFDAVLGDASMLHADEFEELLLEMIRVAKAEGPVALKLATHGSFDEFFSIYWEALLAAGMVDEVWPDLERLINERITVSDAEMFAERFGLRNVGSVTRKEEFSFGSASEFLDSPLVQDHFLGDWVEIVPEAQRSTVLETISTIIDRERGESNFEVSIKATVVLGVK